MRDEQMYATHFQIKYALAKAAETPRWTQERDEIRNRILATIVLEVFVDDVRELVRVQLEEADAEAAVNGDGEVIEWQQTRLQNFDQWISAQYPLGWDARSSATMQMLVRIATGSAQEMKNQLPMAAKATMSLNEFVDAIYTMGHAQTLRAVRSPMYSKGKCWPVARMVITEVHRERFVKPVEEERIEDFKRALMAAANTLRIHVIPGTVGRSHTPSIAAWTTVGGATQVRVGERHLSQSERQTVALTKNLEAARLKNPRATWTTSEVVLEDFRNYVGKQVMPDDWNYSGARVAGGSNLITRTYEWAALQFQEHFMDWRVQLAHLLAILMSKMTPYVFWPATKGEASNVINEELDQIRGKDERRDDAVDIVRKLEWVTRSSYGGISERSQYYTQASIVFLAWIHKESPLRVQIEAGNTKDFDTWNTRHSK